MSTVTTSVVPPAVNVYYDKILCTFAKQLMIYDQFAQRRTIPMNSGSRQVFRRYGTLSAATTPLIEAETKAPNTLSVTDMYADIKQYGDYIVLSDFIQMVEQDKIINETVKIQAEQMALTIDTVVRDMMVSTLSAVKCSHGSNGSSPTEITDADIVDMVMGLRQGEAKMITSMIKASTGFNTGGVLPSYIGLMSVDLQDDLEDLDSFKSLEKYASTSGMYNGEWGATGNVRWIQSTNGYSTGGVYSNFILGQEAYATTKLGGSSAKVIIKQLGSSGVSDALDQRSSVGWKTNFATRVLNDNWIGQLTCTHS